MKGHRPKIRKPIGGVPPPFNHYLTMISPNTFVPVAIVLENKFLCAIAQNIKLTPMMSHMFGP